MNRLCIKIKDDDKVAVVLNLLKELTFVEIEGGTERKGKKFKKESEGSLEDLFGIWENRNIDLESIRKKAWKRI